MNNVALGIKRTLFEKGMIQKVVAERAGFSNQQFSDMLNGRKVIRADYLPDIAKALGVSVNEIFDNGRQDKGTQNAS